jgi:hypothetical protein
MEQRAQCGIACSKIVERDADAGMTQFSAISRNRGRILSKRYLNAPCKYGGAIGIATRAVVR